MKLPRTPPDIEKTLKQAVKDGEILQKLMKISSMVDSKGRYLHWDEMRFKKTLHGLTPEQMWVGVSLARRFASHPLSLTDSDSQPFTY